MDLSGLEKGKFIKRREYLKMGHQEYVHIFPNNLYQIPDGKYIVFTSQIKNEEADFSCYRDHCDVLLFFFSVVKRQYAVKSMSICGTKVSKMRQVSLKIHE